MTSSANQVIGSKTFTWNKYDWIQIT